MVRVVFLSRCSSFIYYTWISYDRMFWTEEHDVILVREMLANSPFANTKRGTVQRGRKRSETAEHLLNVETPRFKVDQRSVRERYSLLAKTYRKKIKEEEGASGISTPELSELDQALEDLIVREDEADRGIQETAAQKRKVKDDKKDAEEIRKRAMERLGDRMKRSENEGKVKKRRSSGNNTLDKVFIFIYICILSVLMSSLFSNTIWQW